MGMATTRPGRVLVVEDDPTIRGFVVEFLESEGFQLEVAEDGEEAVNILDRYRSRSSHLCVILLDMMLPKIDGLGVLRHLKKLGDSVPVIALSASRDHLANAMLAGAAVAVAKPF